MHIQMHEEKVNHEKNEEKNRKSNKSIHDKNTTKNMKEKTSLSLTNDTSQAMMTIEEVTLRVVGQAKKQRGGKIQQSTSRYQEEEIES